jgi:hypothetical protein
MKRVERLTSQLWISAMQLAYELKSNLYKFNAWAVQVINTKIME